MIQQTAARVSEAIKVLSEIANAPDQCGSTVLKLSAKALLERWAWEDEKAEAAKRAFDPFGASDALSDTERAK